MFALPPRPRSNPLSHSQPPFPSQGFYPTGASSSNTDSLLDTYDASNGRHDYYTYRHGELSPGSYSTQLHPTEEPAPASHLVYPPSYNRQRNEHPREPQYAGITDQPQMRRVDAPLMIDTYNLGTTLRSAPLHSGNETSSAHSAEPESWTPSATEPSPASVRPRRARREKPRIDLAPDQPPTTQGKPRARVYVACLQCRTRKIRCDGAKPTCHNCSRRATSNSDCNYDPVPKRRGPDKTPGARQRLAKDLNTEAEGGVGPVRRRRRRATTSGLEDPGNDSPADTRHRSRSDSVSVPEAPLLHPSPSNNEINHSPVDFITVPTLVRTLEDSFPDSNSQDLDLIAHGGFLEPNRHKKLSPIIYDDSFDLSSIIPLVSVLPNETSRSRIVSVDDEGREESNPDISSTPSLNFSRKIWWDSLLSLYISPTANRRQTLTPSQRESAAQGITSDIRFLFRASNYWFSFFHIPSFFGNYFDPTKREKIQPSLILALLSMATFWQSSELGLGRHGRDRALRFRDEAQSALDASFNAGWIDETLAQAAWLLALFEVCAHPRHSTERVTSSMVMLDSIIRSLSLTFVDADDPNTSVFSPGAVPAVEEQRRTPSWHPDQSLSKLLPLGGKVSYNRRSSYHNEVEDGEKGCSCQTMTLNDYWPEGKDHAPLWAATPAWSAAWSEGEIRKESCRRLCWSSMILAAGHASYTTAHRSPHTLNLFISDPANYALLFSGESVASSHYSSKDTVWALHDRSFLLWHGCMRMRRDEGASDIDKAQFAVKTWLEADSLEAALNKHTCAIERAFIFQGREYIFNTRMCISYEFQRYIPLVTANVNGLFHRIKAEEWCKRQAAWSSINIDFYSPVTHQAVVAQRFMCGLHTITGNSNNLLARRPFFVFWFMGQISRALSLWEYDNTLTIAMDVSKALLPALDYLTALWPCPEQRHRYERLRERLANACYVAGENPPPPPNLTLPPPSSPTLMV